jgi:hypothetical protein
MEEQKRGSMSTARTRTVMRFSSSRSAWNSQGKRAGRVTFTHPLQPYLRNGGGPGWTLRKKSRFVNHSKENLLGNSTSAGHRSSDDNNERTADYHTICIFTVGKTTDHCGLRPCSVNGYNMHLLHLPLWDKVGGMESTRTWQDVSPKICHCFGAPTQLDVQTRRASVIGLSTSAVLRASNNIPLSFPSVYHNFESASAAKEL